VLQRTRMPFMETTMPWSWALIGIAIAGAGLVGAYLPRGDRWAVLLPLLAGAGIGIAVVGLGTSWDGGRSNDDWWRVFFEGSIAGFLTVASGLTLLVARSHRFESQRVERRRD
jgi:hypothetical protein